MSKSDARIVARECDGCMNGKKNGAAGNKILGRKSRSREVQKVQIEDSRRRIKRGLLTNSETTNLRRLKNVDSLHTRDQLDEEGDKEKTVKKIRQLKRLENFIKSFREEACKGIDSQNAGRRSQGGSEKKEREMGGI